MGSRFDFRQITTGALGLLVGALGGCGLPPILPNLERAQQYLTPPVLEPVARRQVLAQTELERITFVADLVDSAVKAAKWGNAPGAIAAMQSALDRLKAIDPSSVSSAEQPHLATLRQAIDRAMESLRHPAHPDAVQIIDGLVRHMQTLAAQGRPTS